MASLDQLPIRDDLRGASPYGAPQKPVRYALNVNENTHPVPADVVEDVIARTREALASVNRYPDREFTGLRERLASYINRVATGGEPAIAAANIWAANGSNEVLQHIFQAFGGPGRSVLAFPPTYSMHSIIASGSGTQWVTAKRDADFELSAETVTRAIRDAQPDIVFLCTPNNPTGTPVDLDVIRAAYEATDGIVVVDEAYAEFAPVGTPSAVELLPGRERLAVSRTMSKAFAFAGARLGYLIAAPEFTDALRLVRLPYHLSALTQAAANAALDHADEMLAMVDDIRGQRDRLLEELPKLGLPVSRSWANFVLFRGVSDPHLLFEKLLEKDILIRDIGIPHSLRVTAGTEEETSYFLAALRSILDADPSIRLESGTGNAAERATGEHEAASSAQNDGNSRVES